MRTLCIIVIAVASSVTALTFNCRFAEVFWMGLGANYQCQSKPFGVEYTQYVTSVTGGHMQNKTNDDVVAIHISDCTELSYIPKGLLHFFPNLIAIYLHGCGIAALNGTELNEYPTLKLFALELSPLESVPGNLFAQTPEVFFVSFNDNKIKSTGRDLFRNLSKLSEVNFQNNTCIDANATTAEKIAELKKKLHLQCPLASEMSNSLNGWSVFHSENVTRIDVKASVEKGTESNEKLKQQSSLAGETLNSITLQTLLLSVLTCIGNYLRISYWS